MNKDFERCCSFLADMIIKYAPQIRDEVEMCMMIKDSIDDEKVSRQKQFDRFCYYLGGVKQFLDKKITKLTSLSKTPLPSLTWNLTKIVGDLIS